MKDVLENNARDVLIKEFHFKDGAMDAALEHPMFTLFSGFITTAFIEMGARNYLETKMFSLQNLEISL